MLNKPVIFCPYGFQRFVHHLIQLYQFLQSRSPIFWIFSLIWVSNLKQKEEPTNVMFFLITIIHHTELCFTSQLPSFPNLGRLHYFGARWKYCTLHIWSLPTTITADVIAMIAVWSRWAFSCPSTYLVKHSSYQYICFGQIPKNDQTGH